MSSSSDDNKPFDPFELTAAILLGIGAIGASLAGHQEGLWGGQSVEGYGEASAMTTKASSTFSDELTIYMQDTQMDVRAKELIWEGLESEDTAVQERLLGMANWMLLSQISEHAYEHLQLPLEKRKASWDGDESVTLTHEELELALESELAQDYVDKIFAASEDEFEAADKRFNEGRDANNKGDLFSLAGVILTVALFFAGISLVFKTKMRWGFLGVGTVVLVGGLGYMSTLTWA